MNIFLSENARIRHMDPQETKSSFDSAEDGEQFINIAEDSYFASSNKNTQPLAQGKTKGLPKAPSIAGRAMDIYVSIDKDL